MQRLRSPLHRAPRVRRDLARGGFLLEALVAVLIVAFGLLGLVGLHARSLQQVSDAQYRAEASALANGLIGQMWSDVKDPVVLKAKYDSGGGGAGFTEFQAMVTQRLPGAGANPSTVTFTSLPPAFSLTSPIVAVTIFWQPPGETAPHRYDVTTTIGKN